jgi:hypothetical protein
VNSRSWLIIAMALGLSGCAPLESPLGRVLLLVVVPALIIGAILWFMRGRRGGPRGPVYPDHDRDED